MKTPLVVILARAGSKGVPNKNIAPVAGRPCIAWTIDAARESVLAKRVVVSSDGPAIRAAARAMGVEVVDRPDELATDTSPVDEAVRHAVREVELWEGGVSPADRPVVILYANVPVRPAGLVDRALSLMVESGADSVQSYAPVGKMHPWWMARVDEAGGVRPWEGEVLNHGVYRRQDLPACHVPDGGVLVVKRRALFLGVPGVAPGPHAFFGRVRRGVVNPEGSVVDIDAPIDLIVADAILSGGARAVGTP
jgi:N-acylneuraminate cytidylyltransferase